MQSLSQKMCFQVPARTRSGSAAHWKFDLHACPRACGSQRLWSSLPWASQRLWRWSLVIEFQILFIRSKQTEVIEVFWNVLAVFQATKWPFLVCIHIENFEGVHTGQTVTFLEISNRRNPYPNLYPNPYPYPYPNLYPNPYPGADNMFAWRWKSGCPLAKRGSALTIFQSPSSNVENLENLWMAALWLKGVPAFTNFNRSNFMGCYIFRPGSIWASEIAY